MSDFNQNVVSHFKMSCLGKIFLSTPCKHLGRRLDLKIAPEVSLGYFHTVFTLTDTWSDYVDDVTQSELAIIFA